jgi:2,3-bisphosphoglycerate-independent phosphoglycerate mutase
LCELLKEIKIPGVELFVQTVKEHRFLLVLRGEGLSGDIPDTDPHVVGKQPHPPTARSPEAEKTAELLENFVEQAREKLADQHPANGILLRGFATAPDWPSMNEVFGLNPAAIAAYPMYRGVGRLIGMTTLDTPDDMGEEFSVLEKNWNTYDFFYVHAKHVDSSGEDGNSQEKRSYIEEVDAQIPRLRELDPDVIIVTGDHSTPTLMKSHSWHPVPVLMHGPLCRPDTVQEFGERACIGGGLGPRIPAVDLMPIALAHADRLDKFGA